MIIYVAIEFNQTKSCIVIIFIIIKTIEKISKQMVTLMMMIHFENTINIKVHKYIIVKQFTVRHTQLFISKNGLFFYSF